MEAKTLHPIYHKQFSKLHEKIQNKRYEMQKKIEKSKSIDNILTDLNEEYVYNEKQSISVSDLRNVCDLNNLVKSSRDKETKPRFNVQTLVLNDKYNDAIFKEILYKEATVSESESPVIIDKGSENDEPVVKYLFENNNFKSSLESLNEVVESDESSEPSTPSTKSFRSKIERKLRLRRKENNGIYRRRDSRDKIEKYILSNTTKYDNFKTLKRTKIATVTIVLIHVAGLEIINEDKSRVLLFRFRLGAEKRKSKIVKCDTNLAKFQELFNISLYDDDNILEITLWDREICIGRSVIDLLQLEKEKTHNMHLNMESEISNLETFILLTISGTTLINTLYDDNESIKKKREYLLSKKYAWYRLCDKSNVGFLQVIVYGAKGLPWNDYFCIVKLNNQRIQTQTDYKTNEPSWMKIISFTITDITSILEVIIFEEKKYEEIGKIAITLLSIGPGKKWYALKENTLKERAKGNNPRVLLEMNLSWNLIKAAVKVINPKEPNHLDTERKLDRHVFTKNLARSKAITAWIVNTFQIYKTCFEWESTKLNVISLIIWLTFCYYAEIWMMPLLLLIPFFWYKPKEYALIDWKKQLMKEISPDSDTETKSEKEDKNVSLRQMINSFQDKVQSIQNVMGRIASTGERIKNLFNFTVPFVSFLAIFLIVSISVILYLIPLNYICMIWGVNKFFKKIFRPNRIRNNEMMDLLSRIPDDETLIECKEFPLGDIPDDIDNKT